MPGFALEAPAGSRQAQAITSRGRPSAPIRLALTPGRPTKRGQEELRVRGPLEVAGAVDWVAVDEWCAARSVIEMWQRTLNSGYWIEDRQLGTDTLAGVPEHRHDGAWFVR